MKNHLLVCIPAIVALSFGVSGQYNLRFKYRSKIERYDRKKSSGGKVAVWDGIITIGGAALLICDLLFQNAGTYSGLQILISSSF